jgi:hypothetical protein
LVAARVNAVRAKKGVPRRLAVNGAAAAPLRDGLVTEGRSGEHGEEHAGGTGVVDDAAGRCRDRMCLSDFGVVLIHGVTAGFEGPEGNLGNRERFKVSGGNKRSAEAKL